MLSGLPEKFKQDLKLFLTCRIKREEIIGAKYLDYEKSAELVEGPAFFFKYCSSGSLCKIEKPILQIKTD